MNAITLHAVGLARYGQWQLLDALEVRARANADPSFAGMAHAPGAIALLGYVAGLGEDRSGGASECPECEGDGEFEVFGATGRSTTIDCPWCDGEGESDGPGHSHAYVGATQIKRWTTLNGEPAELDPERFSRSCWMSISDATRVISEYTGLVNRLAATNATGGA